MSRADRFDRADFQSRYAVTGTAPQVQQEQEPAPSAVTPRAIWPVASPRVGQSVLRDRNGKGRPHQGVDLFVPAGSPVSAVRSGIVIRVIDGRGSSDSSRARAGLFVDIRSSDGLIYRYLHLGSAKVRPEQAVRAGSIIGTVAPVGTSGTGAQAHLHLEVRSSDWNGSGYGKAIDPLTILRKA